MSQKLNGPAGRIARLRALMAERGYDAVVVRDEANLRWLTGAMRVFDYTGEYPHAIPGDRVVEKGDFVLMDYGAGYRDYKSDMTRTVCVGEPSEKQREIYDIVRRTHEECVAAIRAGVDGHDIHLLSQKIIGDAGYGEYYGHGLGHGVGIDIHELPVFGRKSNIVEEGAVITVEPGIYLPGVGGVRLEDYGVVTKDGYEPFTTSTHELVVIDC